MDCGRDSLLANGGALGISIFFVFVATGVGCSAMGGVVVFPVSKIGFTVGAGIGADDGIPKQSTRVDIRGGWKGCIGCAEGC